MTQKKVVVTIDPMGQPTIEAFGFAGKGCADATAAIEKALAGEGGTVDKVMKPEYNQGSAQTSQKVNNW